MTTRKKKPAARRKVSVSGFTTVGKTIFHPDRSYRVQVPIRDALKKKGLLLSDDPAPRAV